MQDCSLHFGALTCRHASAKLQCFALLYRDAGGSGDAQTRGAPQSYAAPPYLPAPICKLVVAEQSLKTATSPF